MSEQIVRDFSPVPPQSLEAERSVLGALLQDAEVVGPSLEVLKAEDFYAPQNQAVFEAIRAVSDKGRGVDLVTVDEELNRCGKLEGAGGLDYLMRMMQDVPSTANTAYYISILKEKTVLRRLIRAAGEISRMSYQQQVPLDSILEQSEKMIFDITMRQGTGTELEHGQDILARTFEQIGQLDELKGRVAGVPTGFSQLDALLTGLHGGELILVGARPSMGKTSFAINIAAHAAKMGYTVAIFSLEMPKEQIMMRILCGEARVNMQSVRSGTLKDRDWEKLSYVLPQLASESLYIDDTAGITPSQVRSRCRRLILEKKKLDLIVLDYLQLMSSDGRAENRQLEVSEISRRLKAIALELHVPLVACAQLSRANMQRSDKRPVLSDLRDSGSIEQDADVVMFLHRPNYYDTTKTQEQRNMAEVIVAKQRNGPLDNIDLNWLSECTMFTDKKLAPEAEKANNPP